MLKEITEERDSYRKALQIMTKELNTGSTICQQQEQQQQQSPIDPSDESRVPIIIPTTQNRFDTLNVSPSSSHEATELEESEQRIESGTHVPPVTGRDTRDSEATKSRPIVIIGDSVIKHIDPKKLSQRPVRKFSYPGKTTDEIAEAVTSINLASDPSHVIIHAGTNNLPTDSAQSCAAKIKSLALKAKNKFPNSRIGISGITYREDIQVDSKRNEINETVRLMAGDNSVIDSSGLNGSRLHLNAKGSSCWPCSLLSF